MQSIKYTAESYVPKDTRNIAELHKVSVEVEVEEKVFKEGTPDEFKNWVATIKDIDYKVPNMVIRDLKALLEAFPKLKEFKVLKSGEGMNTSYQTIPLGV